MTGCARLDAIPYTSTQNAATWLTIQPYAAIEIASQEIIVAKKGYFSFREAGLIP
jgi:hypothetical protein